MKNLRFSIEQRPKREKEALEKEKARAQELEEIAQVKQLLIDGYAADGAYEAKKRLEAYFQEPLGATPQGISAEDWQKHGIRKSPAFAISVFAQKIQKEVLQRADEIIAHPAAADIESINTTLALLVAVKEINSYTYYRAFICTHKLESIRIRSRRVIKSLIFLLHI